MGGQMDAFQHAAARRRLGRNSAQLRRRDCFNTQPPEGGWFGMTLNQAYEQMFQHAAARRRLAGKVCELLEGKEVSTRSRPKAAG